MTSIPDFLSLATMLAVLGLIAAGVMKLFQVAADMHELKEILKDMRRMSQGMGSPLGGSLASSLGSPMTAPVPYPAPGVAALSAALPSGVPPVSSGLPSTPVYQQPVVPQAFAPEKVLAPAPLHPFSGTPPTAEELVRAVHAQDFSSDDFPL